MNQMILSAAIDNGVTMISGKMLQFQPDAEEVFDILDPVTGYPTGQTKARSLVAASTASAQCNETKLCALN